MLFRIFLMAFLVNIVVVNAQQNASLRDSINKYQFLNPNLAIKYGMEYVAIREGDDPDIEMVATYGRIGEVLLYMELYSSALEYFNSALQIRNAISEKRGKKLKPNSPWIVLNIGNIYFKNKNYEKALEKFKEARTIFDRGIKPQNRLNGLNTSNSNIGLVYGARGEYEKQEQIYYKVYDNIISNPSKNLNHYYSTILYTMSSILSVKLLKDDLISAENKLNEIIEFYEDKKSKISDLPNSLLTRNYGYAYLAMGAYYQSKKQYKKAIKNLEKAIDIFKLFPVDVNVTRSRLSECYLAIDEIDIAEEIALENLNYKNLSDREKKYNYAVLEKIYKKTKKDKKLIRIKDSLILISSGSNTSKIIKSLNDLETQIILSDSARALNESKIRYNTYLYILIIGSVILFFSLVTIRINYNYQKEKGSRLELEKQRVTEQLNQKNRELVSKTNFIIQTNDYLKNIQKKISSTQQQEQEGLSSQYLHKELNRVINSEKSYEEFDKMFVNVYPNFYKKLNQISKLSQTDLRLASYIKMNHNNNEISQISGISLRTVESQRYRLSKKLNLDKNQDLNSFLMAL